MFYILFLYPCCYIFAVFGDEICFHPITLKHLQLERSVSLHPLQEICLLFITLHKNCTPFQSKKLIISCKNLRLKKYFLALCISQKMLQISKQYLHIRVHYCMSLYTNRKKVFKYCFLKMFKKCENLLFCNGSYENKKSVIHY